MNQEERMYVVENQKVTIENEIMGDRILDIGGGGEGIIGMCYGNRVTAIDPKRDELEEAPEGPLKIVMDARELAFIENTFDAVTSFFTLMYIKDADHERVIREIYRVLKQGGEFIIWDTIIPKYEGGIKDILVVQLEISALNKLINTGYGVLRIDKEQDMEHFIKLGEKAGFKVIRTEQHEQIFKIRFKK